MIRTYEGIYIKGIRSADIRAIAGGYVQLLGPVLQRRVYTNNRVLHNSLTNVKLREVANLIGCSCDQAHAVLQLLRVLGKTIHVASVVRHASDGQGSGYVRIKKYQYCITPNGLERRLYRPVGLSLRHQKWRMVENAATTAVRVYNSISHSRQYTFTHIRFMVNFCIFTLIVSAIKTRS